MEISSGGLDFIKRQEGFVDHVYDDGFGTLHIGYGHRIRPGETFPAKITPDEGLALLAQDTQAAQNKVNSSVKVPLSQQQFDALVSLVFNWGEGNWQKSSHLKYLNAGDYERTAQRISEHPITSRGRVSTALVNRRRQEAAIFRSGMISAGMPAVMIDAGEDQDAPDVSEDTEPDYTKYLLAGAAAFLAIMVINKIK